MTPQSRSCTCWTCFPTPRAKGSMWATPQAIRLRTCTPASSACGDTTCCILWVTMPSGCRPSSTPLKRARTHGLPPNATSPPSAASSRGLASATTGTASLPRPISSTCAGPSGSSWFCTTPGSTPASSGRTRTARNGAEKGGRSASCRFPMPPARKEKTPSGAIRIPSAWPTSPRRL